MRKKLLIAILLFSFIFLLFTVIANKIIVNNTKNFITEDISNAHYCKTALLLGTSKTLKSGKKNAFFYNRIEATAELYKNGKLKFIIVSGDNGNKDYNEPQDMKNELVMLGIPDNVIFLDYAGFRTFDSVIRAKEIFGQDSILIISQKFHNERAIYIARQNNISAWGYNAKKVNVYSGFKTKVREYFARDKVFIDQLLGIQPKFLGQKIELK